MMRPLFDTVFENLVKYLILPRCQTFSNRIANKTAPVQIKSLRCKTNRYDGSNCNLNSNRDWYLPITVMTIAYFSSNIFTNINRCNVWHMPFVGILSPVVSWHRTHQIRQSLCFCLHPSLCYHHPCCINVLCRYNVCNIDMDRLVITRPTKPIGCCVFACCQRPGLINMRVCICVP